jgi:dynein light intermediate chain 1, cytosolic
LKKQALKTNVFDRDKVVVPPNWDSWGKIRVLREGFDVEGINTGWSIDIEESRSSRASDGEVNREFGYDQPEEKPGGALAVYEATIRDPGNGILPTPNTEVNGQKLDVKSMDTQDFLASQLEILERIRRQEAESAGNDNKRQISSHKTSGSEGEIGGDSGVIEEGRVSEHIGPVQFNMGGIQVDADDMLQRLKVRCVLKAQLHKC